MHYWYHQTTAPETDFGQIAKAQALQTFSKPECEAYMNARAIELQNRDWIIDTISTLPEFGSVEEAHLLWKRLNTEQDYRSSLHAGGAASDEMFKPYEIVHQIGEAMVNLRAKNSREVALKIEVACWSLEMGIGAGWNIELLESAQADCYMIDSRVRGT